MATMLAGHLSGVPAMTEKTGGNGEIRGANSTIRSGMSHAERLYRTIGMDNQKALNSRNQ
jgi:hypothetical protein